MRIIMLGTGAFAVPAFAALLGAGHEIPVLVTRPVPPPTGRRKESLHPNPMRDFAEAHQIPVVAPETTRSADVIEQLRQWQPDLLVVCDFGEILSSETLATARLGGINLHASLLPRYRGAAPINWAILRGEKETGISVIHMTPQLDGGPVLAMEKTPIGPDETAAELEPRLARLGIGAVLRSLDLLAHWNGHSQLGMPQDPALVTSARRLKKSDGNLIWSRTARRIRNQIRALQPWPGVFTHWLRAEGPPVRLIIDSAAVVPGPPAVGIAPGQVLAVDGSILQIQTGSGALALERVQPAGKRMMPVAEFLRGNPVRRGDRFGDPETTAES